MRSLHLKIRMSLFSKYLWVPLNLNVIEQWLCVLYVIFAGFFFFSSFIIQNKSIAINHLCFSKLTAHKYIFAIKWISCLQLCTSFLPISRSRGVVWARILCSCQWLRGGTSAASPPGARRTSTLCTLNSSVFSSSRLREMLSLLLRQSLRVSTLVKCLKTKKQIYIYITARISHAL